MADVANISKGVNSSDILNKALELADEGTPVFPVSKQKRPALSKARVDALFGDGKYGFHMASTDPEKIEVMFSENGITGIGMPTGKVSNCTVIDVDCGKGKKHRDRATAWLEKNKGTVLWGTGVVRTGSGGLHYYCAYTEGVKTSASVYADGVDVRNDGGYVVVPPFMGYKWERQPEVEDRPKAPEVPEDRRRGEHIDPRTLRGHAAADTGDGAPDP